MVRPALNTFRNIVAEVDCRCTGESNVLTRCMDVWRVCVCACVCVVYFIAVHICKLASFVYKLNVCHTMNGSTTIHHHKMTAVNLCLNIYCIYSMAHRTVCNNPIMLCFVYGMYVLVHPSYRSSPSSPFRTPDACQPPSHKLHAM